MRAAIFVFIALFALPALAQNKPPATMTPEQAKAAYRQLDPAQKQQVKQLAEQAKARGG